MRFTQDFIEKVREATNIVDLIGQYTPLKRSGVGRLMGLCPFHNERTGSFSVSEQKQMYHCFGCHRAGNVYTFVQEIQGLSFPEAVEYLAGRAAIPLPQDSMSREEQSAEGERRERKRQLHKVNSYALKFFQQQLQALPVHHPLREYLKKRRLSTEIIEQFQLGYATEDWEGLVHSCERQKVPLKAAEALGLIKARTGGKTGHYDLFRHRLMFPIVSLTGEVLGFGGRVLSDEDQPKYLNSPESEVFHKGKVFYGLNESAKHIRAADRVIVVEGYMDYLALFQAGIQEVVATLGTALTPDHAKLIKRYTKNVIVLFDGDRAGQDAAARSLPVLLGEGLYPRGLTLPDELDPDEFLLERGADSLRKLLLDAPELFTVIFENQMKGFKGSAAEKVTLLDRMSPYLAATADARLKALYIRQMAERLKVTPQWIQQSLGSGIGSGKLTNPSKPSVGIEAANSPAHRAPGPAREIEPKAVQVGSDPQGAAGIVRRIRVDNPPPAGRELLNVALMKEEYFQEVMESGELEQVNHEGLRQVWRRAVELYGQMPSKFDSLTALLVSEVEPPEAVSLHLQKPLSDLQGEGARKVITDCVKTLRNFRLRLKSREILEQAKNRGQSLADSELEQIMNIHRNRHAKPEANS